MFLGDILIINIDKARAQPIRTEVRLGAVTRSRSPVFCQELSLSLVDHMEIVRLEQGWAARVSGGYQCVYVYFLQLALLTQAADCLLLGLSVCLPSSPGFLCTVFYLFGQKSDD